jgi:expansin (peptidoglycan-binding protein)
MPPFSLRANRFLIVSLHGIAGFLCLCSDHANDGTGFTPTVLNCADTPAVHHGEATYYTFANGAGACCFDSTPDDLMVGAMNQPDYAGSYVCGSCVEVTGPKGTVTLRIVDLCPECPAGNIDLSPSAFAKIADIALGRVPISWHLIPCGVTGPLVYHFKDGSNQWWTALQIRNHRYPVSEVAYLDKGQFVSVPRTSYNYFVAENGMGPGPYVFRVTDVYGHTLIDSGIVHVENGDVPGSGQFPLCGQ